MLNMPLPELLRLIAPLIVLQFILLTIGLIALKRSERVRFIPKWAWALIIVLINTFGPIAFFIFGRERDE